MVRQLMKPILGNTARQVHPHKCSGDSLFLMGATDSQTREAGIKGGNSESD